MTEILEMAEIRMAEGQDEAGLMAASDRFQKDFLQHQPGFVRRELIRGEGVWYDLVLWRDQAAAEAIMAAAMQSPACAAYFSVMAAAADPTAGVRHFACLARYGRA